MQLFDLETLEKIMDFTDEEIQTALEAGNWHIGNYWKNKNEDSIDYPLALAICYASNKYPKATNRQIGIFAACIQEFTTGVWGGFWLWSGFWGRLGVDQDPLMRKDPLMKKAEDAVITLAGGIPASITDKEDQQKPLLTPEEMTKAGVQLLENIIFKQNTEEAIKQALSYIEKNIELLEKTKQAFKSKLVAEAREEAEQARAILKEVLKN